MVPKKTVKEFLKGEGIILDVRSPSEYAHSHLPGSVSLPLFTDEERAIVGTAYKKQGREKAIEIGIEIAGPKASNLLRDAKSKIAGKPVARVHCWRGGMRSGAVATLLSTAGIRCTLLCGGYKAYRRHCLKVLEKPKKVIILGGLTGSGKTAILHKLKEKGEQVLDLEGLACHRGSAYGAMPEIPQPSTEQFENRIADEWSCFTSEKPVWIEGESRQIGRCKIPESLHSQMCQAPIILVERPTKERLEIIFDDYAKLDTEYLIQSTERLAKRLGSEATHQVIEMIQNGLENNKKKALEMISNTILRYYDKTYLFSIEKRKQPLFPLKGEGLTDSEWAETVLKSVDPVLAQTC